MAPRRAAVYGGLAVLIATGLILHFAVLPAQVVEIPQDERWPRGRWHSVNPLDTGSADDEALARVLSLPYSRSGARAPSRAGVTIHDPDRAWPGYNLYTSGHAPEAILVDMDGRVVHRWRYRFERAFPGRTGDDATLYFRRARVLPDGGLLALYQGLGVIRLDLRSKLIWALPLPVFNDLDVTADGRILTLVKEPREIPELGRAGPVLEDSVVFLDADGHELRRVSLLTALRDSPFRRLLEPLGPTADILHSNTVTRFGRGAAPGNDSTSRCRWRTAICWCSTTRGDRRAAAGGWRWIRSPARWSGATREIRRGTSPPRRRGPSPGCPTATS
jgi:hypothetical protein